MGSWAQMQAAIGLALLAACTSSFEKPKPPDTRALLAAYRTPPGVLSDAVGQAALSALDAKVEGLSAFCGLTAVADVICEEVDRQCSGCAGLSQVFELLDTLTIDRSADAGVPGSAVQDRVQGEGYVRITRICPGHGEEPSPDPRHGKMELVLNVSEQGFDSVAFGSVKQCQFKVLGSPQTLDGEISLTFGQSWGFGPFNGLRPVVAISGSLVTEEGTLKLDTDFEINVSNRSQLALLLDSLGDRALVFFHDSRGSGFRAKNGEFLCNFAEGRCQSGDQSVSLR